MWRATTGRAVSSRCCSAVSSPTSWRRRASSAETSWAAASGSGRGVGWTTWAKRASTAASRASVVASWPMARARVAHLARMDHRHRQPRRRQRGHERDLAPAGHLQHDQLGLQRLQARAHLGDARLVMGADPLRSTGPYGAVQRRFGDVDADVGHVAEIPVALLPLLPPQTARPCLMRARWPGATVRALA
jgi:hypothetical protein